MIPTSRPRETFGDVGRMIEKPELTGDREADMAAHEAVREGEPRRRYARVQDADGHHWVRGNARWTCQTPVGIGDVTQIGRLNWSSLVSMYGPITVLDEHLPTLKSTR